MHLKLLHCPKLVSIMPRHEGEPQLIAIPMSCTMGWVQSPPTFCAVSETICDIANTNIQSNLCNLPLHHLEEAAAARDDLSFSMEP